jgi:hypothetical protein
MSAYKAMRDFLHAAAEFNKWSAIFEKIVMSDSALETLETTCATAMTARELLASVNIVPTDISGFDPGALQPKIPDPKTLEIEPGPRDYQLQTPATENPPSVAEVVALTREMEEMAADYRLQVDVFLAAVQLRAIEEPWKADHMGCVFKAVSAASSFYFGETF